MQVDGGGAEQGGAAARVRVLGGVDGLQLQLVVIDPEVGRGRVEFLPQCSILPLEVGLVCPVPLPWRRHPRASPAHHQAEDDGCEDDDAAGGKDGVLSVGRDAGALLLPVSVTLAGGRHTPRPGPVLHHRTEGPVALAVTGLDLEVISRVRRQLRDLRAGLVPHHALHHPLPVLLPLVHRVEDDVAVDTTVRPPGREPGEGDGRGVSFVSDDCEVARMRLWRGLLCVVVDHEGPGRLSAPLHHLDGELVLRVGSQVVQHGVEVRRVAVVVFWSVRLYGGRAGVSDNVVSVVCDQLVPGQGGVHPGQHHRAGGEDDGVETHRRDEGSGREVWLLVPGPRRLVYRPAVPDVVVSSEGDHVLAVGF